MEDFTLEEKLKIISLRQIMCAIFDADLTTMTHKDAFDFLQRVQKKLADILYND